MGSSEVPVLSPCHGVVAKGAAAADVARELAARGVAEIVDDIEAALAAARSGREVLALDGCAAGCQARLLGAHGIHAERTLRLRDTAADAPAVKSIAELESGATPKRSRRTAAAPVEGSERRAHSFDDYLLAVEALTSAVVDCGSVVDAPTTAADVARLLGVSRPSAGEMIGRLEREGLVRRGASKELLLTREGRDRADRLLRRQRILECFVVSTLGYSPAESYDQAQQIASGFDDDALERVWEALGRPTHCPHGCHVDPVEARSGARELIVLTAVPDGATVTVVQLEERSPERLAALADAGVEVGARLSDVMPSPAARAVTFLSGGVKRLVRGELASAVLVR